MTDISEAIARAAATETRIRWESRRKEVTSYLRGKGYSEKAADLAFHNFLETQVYVAEQSALVFNRSGR